jgi:UDPglucose--hexose-1-phosphate uridylyltransferase
MKAHAYVKALLQYGVAQRLFAPVDWFYVQHRLMALLGLAEMPVEVAPLEPCGFGQVQNLLDAMCDDAIARGVLAPCGVAGRDIFDSALMDCLMARPSQVQAQFERLNAQSAQLATDDYYHLARASNYVRLARVAKNIKWTWRGQFGVLDMTVNLSKPEKDPAQIAAARSAAAVDYPKCLLCRENEGYAGRLDHPARQNLRLIPLRLNGDEDWFLQYSPYEYFNEHCIVLKAEHEPMTIGAHTFVRLLDFVAQFPHYFMGSNADLPIVGGSILSHEHFQGGRYDFAMANAAVLDEAPMTRQAKVRMQMLHWPMSVLRLLSTDKEALQAAASDVLAQWRVYSDERVDVVAHSAGTPHNTITPIARHRNGGFELDLVLRNNRTSSAHPLGIFHPHEALHHIKKENIGLIEVMGLAVLPDRLAGAMVQMAACLRGECVFESLSELAAHGAWFAQIAARYDAQMDALAYVQHEVGAVFEQVLCDAGVFKQDAVGLAAFRRFVAQINGVADA